MTDQPRRPRIDPAWVALGLGAVVLVLAVSWLMSGRAPAPVAAAPDRIAPLAERLATAEATIGLLSDRPAGDPTALSALEERVLAHRETGERALAALEARATQRSTETQAAQTALVEQRLAALAAAIAQRAQAAERIQVQRSATLDQARLTGEASLGQRMTNLETTMLQRLDAVEASTTQRLGAMDQALASRLAPLEQALLRLSAAEARTERLAGIEELRTLLDAGQPLAPALVRLGTPPPPALARFASVAPPTEPALRLSFEEALRQARAAVQESSLPRLNSLLTIRRGEEVVWGDASEANVERARRALEAGDTEAALGHLSRLPEPIRQGLRGWLEEAQSLAAARFALRALVSG